MARRVLEELPRQVEEYFELKKIQPGQMRNVMYNEDIMQMDMHRQPNVQPVYANMNGSLHRQATWEEQYQHKNSF